MAKMSQTVKEIVQIVVFLLVVGIVVVLFLAYPLNRAKAYLARPDIEDFNPDSLLLNDPTPFLELNAVVDTFRVDADGLTSLACVYLTPRTDSALADEVVEPRGTAILIHDERADRTSMIPLATTLLDSGFAVCLYDQRASGLSTGGYHSDGELEASDLEELVGFLFLRDRIHHPLVAIGRAAGADAALLVSAEEPRLDAVVAIEPYITSERWLNMLIDEHDMFWIPFRHTVFQFWYEQRSGYAPQYRKLEEMDPVGCRTLILASDEALDDAELTGLVAMAEGVVVSTATRPTEAAQLYETILGFLQLQEQGEPTP